jgi:predicted DNA-binding transcriptional regulator AlpA
MSSSEKPTEVAEPFASPPLPQFVRFRDLRTSGICDNWQQLFRLIEDHGFPAGRLISPNCRAWTVDEVTSWIASRPTERKVVKPRRDKQRELEIA